MMNHNSILDSFHGVLMMDCFQYIGHLDMGKHTLRISKNGYSIEHKDSFHNG